MIARYTLPVMAVHWSDENKLKYWLKVELAAIEARRQLGLISDEAATAIANNASLDLMDMTKHEADVKHDLIAFVMSVQDELERRGVGKFKGEFHRGLTSYDIEDPGTILLLRYAVHYIESEWPMLDEALKELASKHRDTPMIARTHAQFAQPDTFGRLLLVFADQIGRARARLTASVERNLSEAKMSGAVGNYAGMDPRIEKIALEILGLRPAPAETQMLGRDRHAAVLNDIAVFGSCIGNIARTLHVMSHSLIAEVREGRSAKQRGSSAMPRKRNPVNLEQLFGLPRLLRGYATAAMENIESLEGRDISQSSVERVIFADSTTLLHYMVRKLTTVINGLEVNEGKLQSNLEAAGGTWASGRLKDALIERGVDPDLAYEFVQKLCIDAETHGRSIIELVRDGDGVNGIPAMQEAKFLDEVFGGRSWEELVTDAHGYIGAGVEHTFRAKGFRAKETN